MSGKQQLEVRNLRVAYGTGDPVLRGVDLVIGAGEIVGIVGESGSGKTTLVRSLLGLLPASASISGEVEWGGSLDLLKRDDRKRVLGSELTYVPQSPSTSFAPLRTVGAQVVEPLRLHRALRHGQHGAAAALLDSVAIDAPTRRAKQYPHELSGGMRQRALIASALATSSKLIVADEPTASLDVTTQRKVLNLIDRLVADNGSSLLLVTHDLGIALERCDRIIVLQHGIVIESTTPARLLAGEGEEYTRRLIDEVLGDGALGHGAASASSGEIAAEPVLALTAATKIFRSADAADDDAPGARDVSFTVARGRTVAIVGESGSGKSTVANLIMGELALDSGEITIDGQSVRDFSGRGRKALLRRIQLIHQDSAGSFDPRYTVAQILDEPLRNFGTGGRAERRRRAEELAALVALPAAILNRRARSLSGGQAQRVAIARALAVDPEVLVLDESVSALDVLVRRQILDLIAELQLRLGLTTVFITHDLAVARRISHKVVVMQRGRVVEHGPTADVFERPSHEYTRELIAAVPGFALRSGVAETNSAQPEPVGAGAPLVH